MLTVKKLYKCQKAVQIRKERSREANDPNFSANKNDMLTAMNALTNVGFKVYMYLISNQEGYTFGLSRVDVIEKTGISSKSYTTAVTELIDKGYLIYLHEFVTDGTENAPLYAFYSRPNP